MITSHKKNPRNVGLILSDISAGKTVTRACRGIGITPETFLNWRDADPELQAAYMRALAIGHDALADEALEIIDTDPYKVATPDGGTRIDSAFVAWQKNRVETRLKLLGKWAPRRYGDSSTLEISGNVNVQQDNPAVRELVELIKAAKRGNAIDLPAPRHALPAPSDLGDAADIL